MSTAEWIVQIQTTLGCVDNNEVKIGSICRVAEKIREAEEAKAKEKDNKRYSYRPELAAMGPIHSGTRSDLQIMEETKWRFMNQLLSRPTPNNGVLIEHVQECSEAIKNIESVIRASYGEKIDMRAEELSRIALLDGCFLLELLLKLYENQTVPPLDDEKKTLRLLTDLTQLENQIPFVVLTTLSYKLYKFTNGHDQKLPTLLALSQEIFVDDELSYKQLSPQKLAQSLLECQVPSAEFSKGVYHLLHLVHLCSPDPHKAAEYIHSKDPLQLQRCARKLQAFGITIEPPRTNDFEGELSVNETGIVASPLIRKFVDKFDFKIVFDEKQRKLTIPTLHIKEATEVKWRNLIAWEQLGLDGVGYKFTSYAYFFKGLVCSVHDIQLLKDNGIIQVDNKEVKDDDLLMMFKSITTGAERMDGRYRKVCEGLNRANANNGCGVMLRMALHYFLRFDCVNGGLD